MTGTFNDTFLRAARGEATDYTPIWIMRQAGRYLPEYQALRTKHDVLTMTRTPEIAAAISLQPVRRFGLDACILFADIMLVPIAMGVDVRIVDAIGPVIDEPITSLKQVKKLKMLTPDSIDYLLKTIKILRGELTVPLIGFSGAPFTLASYLIQGQPSRDWQTTKLVMYQQPQLWAELMTRLTDAIIVYLQTQVAAGAQAIQLFDSWVGCLSPSDFRRYVLPYNQRIMTALGESQVPRIVFGTDTGAILGDFAEVDCEVVGVDWRIDIGRAQSLVAPRTIQGNLDPVVLVAGGAGMRQAVDLIFDSLASRQNFIFNLGHGILPETKPANVQRLVDYVHSK